MNIRVLLVSPAAAVLVGCGSQARIAGAPTTRVHRAESYRLYTHCGIEWARIDGTFWRATKPVSDGNGNPPRGWGNPFQAGMLTLVSHTTAEFASPAGTVTFERTSRTAPPSLCS